MIGLITKDFFHVLITLYVAGSSKTLEHTKKDGCK